MNKVLNLGLVRRISDAHLLSVIFQAQKGASLRVVDRKAAARGFVCRPTTSLIANYSPSLVAEAERDSLDLDFISIEASRVSYLEPSSLSAFPRLFPHLND